jgi:anti-sigma B factor antagonist
VSLQRWPVRWTGQCAIIELPADLDAVNAPQLREQLLTLISDGGAATVIADMTLTRFCDSAGMTALITAHRKATAQGAVVKVVAAAAQVLRIFELTGFDQVVDVLPSLDLVD